jgi:hypothetical protein
VKYLVAGTSEANQAEVIASLESLWDAADEQGVPFELLFREQDAYDPDTILAWAKEMGCHHEVVPEGDQLPPFDTALLLVGEHPDAYTLGLVTHYINEGVEVRDLAGQMVQLEWETEKLPEEPVSFGGGWPGEEPQSLPAAPEPEKSREVPAKAPAPAQVDPAVLLKDVTETDLEAMPKAALKALVEKLGIEADKRSAGQMVNAIMEVIIDLDKSPGMYDLDADEFMASMPEPEEFIDPVTNIATPLEEVLGARPLVASPWDSPPTAVVLEVICHDGSSKKKVIMAPFTVELSNLVNSF